MPQKADRKETFAPEDETSIPDEFYVDSKVIFISNYPDIPSMIDDDILSIQLNYTKEQALSTIKARLEELLPEYPELTIEDKMEVLSFIKKNKKGSTVTLSEFIHIAMIWRSRDTNREQWALKQLK